MKVFTLRFCLFFCLSWLFTTSALAQGVAVTLAQAETTYLSEHLYATGRLEARNSTEIRTQVTGRVVEHHLEDGALVQAGQLLVQLDDREPQARLLQAQVTLREAERQLLRDQQLKARQVISADQLAQQQAAVDNAQAQVLAAQAEVDRYRLVAPFSGMLGNQDLTTGMLLDSGQTLTTLDDLSQMRVEFALAERHLSRAQPGQTLKARVSAWPDQEFTGELSTLATRLDPNTLNLQARGLIANPDLQLRPGMLASITLQTSPRLTLMVPARSLSYSGSEKFVFIVDENQQVSRQPVEIGLTRARAIEITSGLSPGDQVIDQGVVKVREGMRVRVVATKEDAS